MLFEKIVKFKGNNAFEKGIWAGKHPWSDSRVILAADGAYEVRTIRRLANGENFIATDIHCGGPTLEFFSTRDLDETCWTGPEIPSAYIGDGRWGTGRPLQRRELDVYCNIYARTATSSRNASMKRPAEDDEERDAALRGWMARQESTR